MLPRRRRIPKQGANVVAFWTENSLIGDWADREDIGDGLDYARSLRRQAETRRNG